jgi:uncharacterized protein YdeI (YjbR/CyaY-like superfamily)
MEKFKDIKAVKAVNRDSWRKWLLKNHEKERSVWLIMYHIKSKTKSIYYNDAVEEALCFGWIDSTRVKRDTESYYQYFAKRRPGSNWSQSNRDRVKKLIAEGLMTPAGQVFIDIAKKKGTWNSKIIKKGSSTKR